MITTLILGDWSDDGHGKTSTLYVKHNFKSTQALKDAYRKGCIELDYMVPDYDHSTKEVGEKPCEDVMYNLVASEYEDGSVPRDLVEKLTFRGLGPDKFTECDWYQLSDYAEDEEGPMYIVDYYEGFARMWLEIAKLANPDLEYEFVDYSKDSINIGGYGLFY